MTTAVLTDAQWKALPKVLLHEHLDGGLRPQTLLDLCRMHNVSMPGHTAEEVAAWLLANSNSGSLERYLTGFGLTIAAMASEAACERVAFEAAEDARMDGCVLAEFRIAPLLLEAHGLAGEVVVEALLHGLKRSGLPCGLIVCAMRTDAPESTARGARLAARYRDDGVIGFDLAGAERGFPPTPHREAINVARDAGLGITLHAGEADEGSRVLEAASLGATRIGHGVTIMNSPDLAQHHAWVDEARRRGLHFEVCVTSNVHTNTAESFAAHPLRAMAEAGLSVSVSTDNRLMSDVTLSGELRAVHEHNGIDLEGLETMMRAAASASFLPQETRNAASVALDGWPDR